MGLDELSTPIVFAYVLTDNNMISGSKVRAHFVLARKWESDLLTRPHIEHEVGLKPHGSAR